MNYLKPIAGEVRANIFLRKLTPALSSPHARTTFLSRRTFSTSPRNHFKSRLLRPISDPSDSVLYDKYTAYYYFGSGEHGQLGCGKEKLTTIGPAKVDALESGTVAKLVVGHNHSVAIMKDGTAKSWGYNQTGQLGQGHRDPVYLPTHLVGLEGHQVIDVACGPLQTWISTRNLKTGKQAVWHCGVAYEDESPVDKFTMHVAQPRKVKKREHLGAVEVKKVIPAADFCLFLSETGRLYSFGNGLDVGALGHGQTIGDENLNRISTPTVIPVLKSIDIVDADVGWGHCLALAKTGDVFAWGSNKHGQCGLDLRSEAVFEPRLVPYFQKHKASQVVCGETHSLVLDVEGFVHVFGSYAEGKLGLGENVKEDVIAPRQVHFFDDKDIIHIAAGTDHSAALTRDGRVYLWGFGQHGALSMESQLQNQWSPMLLLPPMFFSPLQGRPEAAECGEDYPYVMDGIHMYEGEFFQKAFTHRVTDVQCGMDTTMIVLQSDVLDKYKKNPAFQRRKTDE